MFFISRYGEVFVLFYFNMPQFLLCLQVFNKNYIYNSIAQRNVQLHFVFPSFMICLHDRTEQSSFLSPAFTLEVVWQSQW